MFAENVLDSPISLLGLIYETTSATVVAKNKLDWGMVAMMMMTTSGGNVRSTYVNTVQADADSVLMSVTLD